jgi:hypothetical protein
VKYELGFHITEGDILHSERNENLKSHVEQRSSQNASEIKGDCLQPFFCNLNTLELLNIFSIFPSGAVELLCVVTRGEMVSVAKR